MPAVHAIKIADTDYRCSQAGGIFIEMAEDAHGLDPKLKLQSIWDERNWFGRRSVSLFVSEVVRHVGEKRALGFEAVNQLEGIFKRGVCWMGPVAECVEKKNIEAG